MCASSPVSPRCDPFSFDTLFNSQPTLTHPPLSISTHPHTGEEGVDLHIWSTQQEADCRSKDHRSQLAECAMCKGCNLYKDGRPALRGKGSRVRCRGLLKSFYSTPRAHATGRKRERDRERVDDHTACGCLAAWFRHHQNVAQENSEPARNAHTHTHTHTHTRVYTSHTHTRVHGHATHTHTHTFSLSL